jgi:hypothetical protein
MPRLKFHTWLTAAFGLACSAASASEPATVLNADAAFQNPQGNWIQQVQCADAPCAGAVCAPGACDSTSGHSGCGLCGGGELGDAWTLSSLFGDDPCFTVGGWFQAGYHNKSDGVFNTHPDRLNLHQGWLYLEKATDGSEGFDIGGRADLIYGVDGPNTQAFGNTPGVFDYSDAFNRGDEILQSSHGWAIPQLYAEAAYHDWKVKAGHYYTMHGYEVVPATGNFFYSHAFTMNFSEAFTHTGVHTTYTGIENVELYLGWALGWDTGFDQFNSGNIFHGGFKVTPVEDVAFTYVTSVGNLGWIGEGYAHSVVVTFALTDKLSYITQSDFIHTNVDPFGASDGYNTIGWNNYLIYWATDRVGFGGRAEWWKAQGVSYYEVTGGVNFKPMANVVIRPEVRYQWAPAAGGPGGNNPVGLPNLSEPICGVDAILTF